MPKKINEFIGSDNLPISGNARKNQYDKTSVNINPDNPDLRGTVPTTDNILQQSRSVLPWYLQYMIQIPVREELIKGVETIDAIKNEYSNPILHNIVVEMIDNLNDLEAAERREIIKLIHSELKKIYSDAKII